MAAVLVVVTAVVGARSASRALVAGPPGLSLAYRGTSEGLRGTQQRLSPWASIRRVGVDPVARTVTVVLRADAPMPPWLTARITDPRDPQAGVSYQRRVPGLDPAALETVVRALAPWVEVRTEAAHPLR